MENLLVTMDTYGSIILLPLIFIITFFILFYLLIVIGTVTFYLFLFLMFSLLVVYGFYWVDPFLFQNFTEYSYDEYSISNPVSHNISNNISDTLKNYTHHNYTQNYTEKYSDKYSDKNEKEKDRVWVCMTTIPERARSPFFEKYLKRIIDSVSVYQVILLIPLDYKKFGCFKNWKNEMAMWIVEHPQILILHPPDQGPATKLLGLQIFPVSISEKFTKQDLLMIIDDDLLYHERLIDRMVQQWNHNNSNDDKFSSTKKIMGNIVYLNPQSPTRLEVQGSAGYLTKFQWILDDLPSIIKEYKQHEESCWNVDDTLLSYCFSKEGYEVSESGIPISDLYVFDDYHPPWFELKNTHREIDTAECLYSFEK